jgi:hypothetical protein
VPLNRVADRKDADLSVAQMNERSLRSLRTHRVGDIKAGLCRIWNADASALNDVERGHRTVRISLLLLDRALLAFHSKQPVTGFRKKQYIDRHVSTRGPDGLFDAS